MTRENKDDVEKIYNYYFNQARNVKVTYISLGVIVFLIGIVLSVLTNSLSNNSFINQYISLDGAFVVPIIICVFISFTLIGVGINKEREYLYKAHLLKETHEVNKKLN